MHISVKLGLDYRWCEPEEQKDLLSANMKNCNTSHLRMMLHVD